MLATVACGGWAICDVRVCEMRCERGFVQCRMVGAVEAGPLRARKRSDKDWLWAASLHALPSGGTQEPLLGETGGRATAGVVGVQPRASLLSYDTLRHHNHASDPDLAGLSATGQQRPATLSGPHCARRTSPSRPPCMHPTQKRAMRQTNQWHAASPAPRFIRPS